jgi:hypothetical protein
LPVYDIKDEIPESFLSILYTIGITSDTEGLVVPKGKPKYAKGRLSTLHPKIFAKSVALALSILIATSSLVIVYM